MQALRITIPIEIGYVTGDAVNVTVNGVRLNAEPIQMFPGQAPYTGYLRGRQFDRSQFGVPPGAGYLGGTQFSGRTFEPGREIVLETMPLYYGLKTIGVTTLDYLGNGGGEYTSSVFLCTGPHAPRNLKLTSPTPATPTFTFVPSAELQ